MIKGIMKTITDRISDEFLLTRARIKLLEQRGHDVHIIKMTLDVKKPIVDYVLGINYDGAPVSDAQRNLLKAMFMNGNGLGQTSQVYKVTQDIIRLGFPLGNSVKHYQDAIAAGKYGTSEMFLADTRMADWLSTHQIKRITKKTIENFIEEQELKTVHSMRAIAMAVPRTDAEMEDLVGDGIMKHMDRIGW